MASTNQINKVVELIAVLGDLIILNFSLFQLLLFWEKASIYSPFSCTVSLMMTSLSLCYIACSASRGRAWDSREIRADQLVLRVLKNIITFSVFWACIMTFSGISIISPLFFVYMRSHYWYELTGEEIERFKLFYGSLSQRAKDPTHFFRRESVLLLLRIFYLDIYNEYYSKSHLMKGGSDMGKSKLAHDFFCLIMQHYREHKDVAFYADKLCITSKYLSMVIKEASGKTAKDWIVEYAILEIKAMLKNSTMNIQEISIKTNFANQSSLGRFFRKHTGMTLTEYRMHR